jgi:hypothetical protein
VITDTLAGIKERPAASLLVRGAAGIPVSGIYCGGTERRTNDEVRLLVALAADGSVNHKGRLDFGFTKARKIERLENLLVACGIPFVKTVTDKITRFGVNTSVKPSWLQKGFGPWVLNLSHEQRRIIIEELPHWDGYRHQKNGAVQISTTSTTGAEWLSTIAHLAGMVCSVNTYPASETGFANGKPRIVLYFKAFKECRSTTEVRNGRGSTRVSEVDYSGKVYCPQVPSGAFLVRYQNRIHVTGNCQNLPKAEIAGVEIRKLIEAPKGKTLVVADLAQIESRVICYLAEDEASLDIMRSGMDVYEAHARATMGYNDPRPLKEVDNNLRQLAKARVLGLGFGCGAEKFQVVAKIMAGLDISEEDSARIVREYRASNPKITELWASLDANIKRNYDRDMKLGLPSGRTLTYWKVAREGRNSSCLIPRNGTLMRSKIYGGLLAENVTQAAARDVFMHQCRAIEQAGYEIILRVHDEVVVLVDEADAEHHRKEIERLMTITPDWCEGLPLGAEASITNVYCK